MQRDLMKVNIRVCQDHDYEAVARIQNAVRPEPTTAEDIAAFDRLTRSYEGARLIRVVAEDELGQVIGVGTAIHFYWMLDGRWSVKAMVDPSARSRGVGLALYEHVAQVAREGGANEFESWVEGTDDASYAWAQRRGFEQERQRTEAVLDLTTFDLTAFAGAREKVEASGLRLAMVSEVDDDLLRQLWELDNRTTPDVPIWDPTEKLPTYEEYVQFFRETPEEKLLACCFDGDRLVGVSILEMPQVEGAGAYTGFTGVYREYRGRGIALAVKLLTIETAQQRGIKHMRTNNDPDNPPMLAVNVKLGYQFIPGPRRLRRDAR